MLEQFETTEPQAILPSVEPAPWRGLGFFSKLVILFLPLLGILFFVLPFLDQVILLPARQVEGLGPVIDWLVNGGGSWIVGAAIFALWLALLVIIRFRLYNNEHLWVDSGCPQCRERELVRVSRERSDRFYNLLRIPAYRYACRNCTWRGLRIGRRHRPYYVDPISEELALAAVAVGQSEIAPAVAAQPPDKLPTDAEVEQADILDEILGAVTTEEDGETLAHEVPEQQETARLDLPPEPSRDTSIESSEPTVANEDDLEWLWQRLNEED